MARHHQQTNTGARLTNLNMRLPQLNSHALCRLVDVFQHTSIYLGPLYGINLPGQLSVAFDEPPAVNCLRGTAHEPHFIDVDMA